MRKTGLPETCRFCLKGNERCPQRIKETEKQFPDESYSFLIPTAEWDAMGVELNERVKCFKEIYHG